jgi:hypothetical protein
MPTDRQPASIVIGELETLSTKPASEDPMLFHQLRDRLGSGAPSSQSGWGSTIWRADASTTAGIPQVLPMSVDPDGASALLTT